MEFDRERIKRILVINLAFIGDVILSGPAIRALKETYPHARIDILTVPVAAPIARLVPYVDRVFEYDKRGKHKNVLELWRLVKGLRAEKYDLSVSMNFALRASLVAWAAGATYRLGYNAQHASMFLTHVASSDRSKIRHESENYLALLKPLGIEAGNAQLELKLTPEALQRVQKKVAWDEHQPLIIICPFGRNPLNCWAEEGYAEVIRRLAGVASCILIGGKVEKARLEKIRTLSGVDVLILAGVLSMEELAALMKQADLVITVDTGPLHIAGGVGTPILGLFSRSDYRVWGPRGTRDKVLHNKVECWPCNKWECNNGLLCMRDWTADKIIDVAIGMLNNK